MSNDQPVEVNQADLAAALENLFDDSPEKKASRKRAMVAAAAGRARQVRARFQEGEMADLLAAEGPQVHSGSGSGSASESVVPAAESASASVRVPIGVLLGLRERMSRMEAEARKMRETLTILLGAPTHPATIDESSEQDVFSDLPQGATELTSTELLDWLESEASRAGGRDEANLTSDDAALWDRLNGLS